MFAIPVSVFYNGLLGGALTLLAVDDPALLMLSSAALVSKLGSETPWPDSSQAWPIATAICACAAWTMTPNWTGYSACTAVWNLLLPEQGVLELLERPKELLAALESAKTGNCAWP